jgi:selenocysteine-specific elongation factor
MRSIVVGTAGHIDHGNSSLVLAQTGIDPDRLKEEKARGITIELGFAHVRLGDATIAFVDVPGHERFVRTMLAGVGGIDAVMLVVAADESVMPQTREHFDICRLLQVGRGLVVLTKTDLVDDETLELVRLEVRELVAGSFLESAPVMAVSARTGVGLDPLRLALAELSGTVGGRPVYGAARLPVDRVFSMQGFGTVITGTLVAGRIRVDDELASEPGGRRVRVRGIHVHGQRAAEAIAGQRTALNLGGVDLADVVRGQTLATPTTLTVTRRVDALVDVLPSAKPLRHGARVRFHHGTRELLGRLSVVGRLTEIAPGTRAAVRLRLESPAALTRADRFIVRAYSPAATVGGGLVIDPDPPRSAVRTAAAEERFRALQPGTAGDSIALERMVVDTGSAGLPFVALTSRAGVPQERVSTTAENLVGQGLALLAGDRLVTPAVVSELSSRLMALVDEFHRANPLADGIPREEARERLFARADPMVFELVLSRLAADGRLTVRDRIARAGHRLDLSADEMRARDAIERVYRQAGLKPPDASGVAVEAGVAPALAEKMSALLLRQKRLARVDTLIFHVDALASLKDELKALRAQVPDGRATIDVAGFKERYGVTRKFAIPLLEWLDRERVTKRAGETRTIL